MPLYSLEKLDSSCRQMLVGAYGAGPVTYHTLRAWWSFGNSRPCRYRHLLLCLCRSAADCNHVSPGGTGPHASPVDLHSGLWMTAHGSEEAPIGSARAIGTRPHSLTTSRGYITRI